MRLGIQGLVLALTLTAPALAGPPAPRLLPGDAQDFVFLHASRPYLVRLHLQLDDRSFRADWGDRVRYLFEYLDVDRNGVLSQAELAPAPSAEQWQQLSQGTTALEPDAAPAFADVDVAPADGKITLAELQRHYQRVSAGPLQVRWARQAYADPRTAILLRHLDTDRDGKLSLKELKALPAVLNRLDLDGDEMIVPAEMGPGFNTPPLTYSAPGDPAPPLKDLPFLILLSGDDPTFVARLLERYDRDHDKRLGRTEIGLDRVTFDRLDRNHDNQLDAGELAAWRAKEPDVELVVPLGPKSSPAMHSLPGPDGRPRPLAVRGGPGLNGSFVLPFREAQVEVRTADGVRTTVGAPAPRQSPRDYYRQQFRALDANKDRFLDSKEIYRPPFALVALLRLADRDGDNRVSEKEFTTYLELQDRLLGTQVHLTVMDHGRPFYEMLDADHDRRLSQREMRTAWKRLDPWFREGHVTPESIPQQFELILTRGPLPQEPAFPGMAPATPPVVRRQGPLWFRKMDRNHDGDVSPFEFLGTPEQFRRIDADGDGLLDPAEADRADKEMRKNRRGPG